MAQVKECKDGFIIAEQRNKFSRGDELDALMPGEKPVVFTADEIFDGNDNEIESAPHPMMTVKIPCDRPVLKGSLLRTKKPFFISSSFN